MEATLLAALAAAIYLGFAMLALSQDRHWQRAGGGATCPPRLVYPLRAAGCLLLLAALPLALLRDGAGLGALLWATLLTAGAGAVVCTLAWRAHWLRPFVRLLQGFA